MLKVPIKKQPDESTCGPTCLHSLYEYYHDSISLQQVIDEVAQFEGGGTAGTFLAIHALKRGYQATIYSYNLQVFDPSWFNSDSTFIIEKLQQQIAAKRSIKLQKVCQGYIEFLTLGGKLCFEDLRTSILRRHLKRDQPIIAGLSATYLYQSMREYGPNSEYDDIRGVPAGHFVLLSGYDKETREIGIADPIQQNPLGKGQIYNLNINRVLNAILLGIITYDANLIILTPKSPHPPCNNSS
jgi:hypothetical protein